MCPNCEEIQEWLEDNPQINNRCEEVDATTKEGIHKAKEYGVKGVPTIIFLKSEKRVGTIGSLEELEKVIKNKSLDDY